MNTTTNIRICLYRLVAKTCLSCILCIIGFLVLPGTSYTADVDLDVANFENDFYSDKTDQIRKFLGTIPLYSQNLYLGPVKINPSLEIIKIFDDNVFGAANDKVGDFYTKYSPKLGLSLPFLGRHSISLNYKADAFEYHRIQQRDHFNQRFTGSLKFNFNNGFNIYLSNNLSSTRTPIGVTRRVNPDVQFADEVPDEFAGDPEFDEEFIFNTLSRRRDFVTNRASVEIDFPDFFNKVDFSIFYSNTDSSYQRERSADSERNIDFFRASVSIMPTKKIRILTGFNYAIVRYDSASEKDSIYHEIPFDISWQPTRKSYFFLNTMFRSRDYGNASGGIFENYQGWDASLGYRFNVTKRDNLTMKFERSLKEQRFRVNQVTVPGDTFGDFVGDNNPSFFTQINIDYTHKFSNNITAKVSPYYQNRRFRKSSRAVSPDGEVFIARKNIIDTIGVDISARYEAPRKWLFGELSYSYQDRKSNRNGGDLVKNVGRFSVGINF